MKSKWVLIFSIVSLIVAAISLFAANEITVTGTLKLDNGQFSLTRNVSNLQLDQQGTSIDYHIQNIGTGAQELVTVVADVASNGMSFARNLTTNAGTYIELGPQGLSTNFLAFVRLRPGEIAVLSLHPTNPVYAQASGTNSDLEIWIVEE